MGVGNDNYNPRGPPNSGHQQQNRFGVDPDEYDENEAWSDVQRAREKSGTETGGEAMRSRQMMAPGGGMGQGPSSNFDFNFDSYNDR